jgi:transcriptional regulator with XRE-family HTH domain
MHSSHPSKVSTLRGQLLGQQLRGLREQAKVTLEEAAGFLNRDRSALGRFERAEWPFPRPDVQLLLDFYGVGDKNLRAHYTRLSEEAWRRDEWETKYTDAIYDQTFVDLPWLEGRAERIRAFDLGHLPGLLQTPEYAAALIRASEVEMATDAQVDRWVELRMARQRVLAAPQPTQFACVIAEAVLRARIGGDDVMRTQLEHLAQLGRQRHIVLRVLPLAVGAGAGVDGAFMLFELPKPFPEVAYVEHFGGRLFLEWPKSSHFVQMYDRLCGDALTERESAELVMTIAEEI